MIPEKTIIKFGGIPVYANGLGAKFDEDVEVDYEVKNVVLLHEKLKA